VVAQFRPQYHGGQVQCRALPSRIANELRQIFEEEIPKGRRT
jgi:hypothetical protein